MIQKEQVGPDPPVYPAGMPCPTGDPVLQFEFHDPKHPVINGREVRQVCDEALEIYQELLHELDIFFADTGA